MGFRTKLTLLMIMDSVIVSTAIFIASWITYPYEPVQAKVLIISAVTLLIFHHVFAIIYHLYRQVWSYASVGELVSICKSVTLSIFATALVQYFVNDFVIYRRALIVTWMMHIILIGGSRFIWRIWQEHLTNQVGPKKRTLIIGAGAGGALIARQLTTQNGLDLSPVGFVDDDRTKQKMQLYNLPILGTRGDIEKIVEKYSIEHIIIAIPSLERKQINDIVAICHRTNVKTQIVPKVEDLLTGKVTVSQLKDVEVEDLLGREPVELDIHIIKEHVTAETVMVTGAGGSIGSELCRQLVSFNPSRLILLGHGEYSIYSIDMELKEYCRNKSIEIIPVIGDVQDRNRMFDVMAMYRPVMVYHAAAHKHVPLMEYNPHEAVKNNVIGTKNVAEAAETFGVKTFVLVSTDKAVKPTSVMGATKRVAEMVIQDLNTRSQTTFAAVRFGNVLGSRGSVIPLFKKQINNGGPVTVTDSKMTRYFMTISEASRLVIQASTLARDGEIFVLDMGQPVKIIDLARNLIHLSGYTEDEIPIVCTGIRPGEKMYEEYLDKNEILPDEIYEKIYVGKTTAVNTSTLLKFINQFEDYSDNKLKEEIMNLIQNREYITYAAKKQGNEA